MGYTGVATFNGVPDVPSSHDRIIFVPLSVPICSNHISIAF